MRKKSAKHNKNSVEIETEDLVFAKMKGYPHWPAKVIKKWRKLNSDLVYQVIFYGTYEM